MLNEQQGWHSDSDGRRIPRSSIELPPIHLSNNDITSDPFPALNSGRPRDLLPSILSGSPPERSSTLPPIHRSLGATRPRKQSVTKRGRESYHKKQRSKGTAHDWLRRIQNDERLRPGPNDRKALSAEPSADYGKRWEDLIDAADQAASASGDADEDRTPVSLNLDFATRDVGPNLTSRCLSLPCRFRERPCRRSRIVSSSPVIIKRRPSSRHSRRHRITTSCLIRIRSLPSRAARAATTSTWSRRVCKTRRQATLPRTPRYTAPRVSPSRS